MNVPNTLTLMRIVLIPVLVLIFYWPFPHHQIAAAVLFAIASITDWLDGYLARKLGQMTSFGAFLDPVADKLMVSVALVLLVEQQQHLIFTLAALVIIGREIVISALREWMAELGQRTSITVSYLAKVKTFVQMVAITCLLAISPEISAEWFVGFSYLLLYLAAGLTLWSMVIYVSAAIKVLQKNRNIV